MMPRQSVWFVRASLIYLAAGFTFGALMLANKGILISPFLLTLLPAHMEFLLIGWLVQLAMGVAFWIAPRFSGLQPRGNVRLIFVVFWLLNLGIIVVSLGPYLDLAWLRMTGRTLEGIAVLVFGFTVWGRIKPHG